ncbi:MAG: pectin acetylesterase-family hydrolase [Myxococcales bacterium]
MLGGRLGQRWTPLSQSALGLLGLALVSAVAACGDSPDSDGDTMGEEQPFDRKWDTMQFPDAFCRDGSNASILISKNPNSKNLMIFLEGGGACYDDLTCLANPPSTLVLPMTDGIWDETKKNNPVKGWNMVYVPYCTGDSHSGTNPAGVVPKVAGTQKFVGYTNMGIFLKAIVPMFPDIEKVLLTGISAGGFGASANTVQVMNAFPSNVKGVLLDDSGPAMSSKYLAPCLQERWRNLWGLDNSMLKDCGTDCPNQNDFVLDFSKHLAKTYGDRKSGIIEASEDGVITRFFGVGQNECTGSFVGAGIPGPTFTEGLLDFRAQLAPYPNFYTYFPSGDKAQQHTWLTSNSLYEYKVGDVAMIDWVTAIINGEATVNAGP